MGVYDSSLPGGDSSSRHMKIQPFRLVPMKNPLAPMPAALQERRNSSRAGSQVSRSLSQAGSAISSRIAPMSDVRSVLSGSKLGQPGKTPYASPLQTLQKSESEPMLST